MRDADIIESGLWNSLYKEQRDIFSCIQYRINIIAFNNSKHSSSSLKAYFKSVRNQRATNLQRIIWEHQQQS